MINIKFCNKRCTIRSLRLSVRTRGFHPRKRGSIPLGTASFMSYFVYLIKTTSLFKKKSYVGYTNNLKKRLILHNSNKGAKSTKGFKWILVYKKKFLNKSKAMSYEYYLKKNYTLRKKILSKGKINILF